ncbi:MAG: hypothetical protein ACK2T4_05690 [Candidatus Promineifilaceae bacterium]|jgi:hypothetical protein
MSEADMGEGDKKAAETAEEKGLSHTTINVQGNYYAGDQISTGDITNSEGIAIGRGASANVAKGASPAGAAGGTVPGAELDARVVYQSIVDQFDLAEIQELCFDLKVEFEDLGGSGRKGKARELVKYMERRGRLGELDAWVRELRKGK